MGKRGKPPPNISPLRGPCEGCPDRSIECHASCSAYRAYVDKCEELRRGRFEHFDAVSFQKQVYEPVRKRVLRARRKK